MAEHRPVEGPTGLEETYDFEAEEVDRNRVRRDRKTSRAPARYWRQVPVVSVLPSERKQIRSDFLIRGLLVVVIGLLGLFVFTRYTDWTDAEVRAEAVEVQSRSVKSQLTVRQNEIEPLQSQINLLTLELESAETTYELATADQADWFSVMGGLLAISVGGVDFVSAAVNSEGEIILVGVATSPDAIASLPTQLSQLSGVVDLQGIQWDAAASPPVFTAEFQVAR